MQSGLKYTSINLNFEEIYNDHKVLVYNLALHYVQNIEDAEEIMQDVFLKVHQSLDSFKEKSSISTWLYRITINQCLDFIKSKNRQKRFAFITSLFSVKGDDVRQDAVERHHPGIQLENKEALENLMKHINNLPDQQKTALILHKIEQKTQVEVGDIMTLSAKAVESLIQRAKINLSKNIESGKG